MFDTYPYLEDIQIPGWNIVAVSPNNISIDRFFKGLAHGTFFINPRMRAMEALNLETQDYYSCVVGRFPLLRNQEYSTLLRTLGIGYTMVNEGKKWAISLMYHWLIGYSLLQERKPEPELEDRILDTGLTVALGCRVIAHYNQLNRAMASPNTIDMSPETILSDFDPDTYMVIPSLKEATQLVWKVVATLI